MNLEARMCQLLAEMSVIAEGDVSRLEGRVVGGERDYAPRGSSVSMGERWRDKFLAASPKDRRAVVLGAQQALREARFSRVHVAYPGTVEWKLTIVRFKGSVGEAAHKFGISERHVYRLRAELADSALLKRAA